MIYGVLSVSGERGGRPQLHGDVAQTLSSRVVPVTGSTSLPEITVPGNDRRAGMTRLRVGDSGPGEMDIQPPSGQD